MNDLTSSLKNAIDRFLVEMPPYWKKNALERLLGDLQSKEALDALEELVRQGVIHLTKNDDCYIVLTEEYLRNHLPPGLIQPGVARVQELLVKYLTRQNS